MSVEAQGQVIEMYHVSDAVSKVIADDDMYGVYYDDVFGEFTGIRYEPSFSGYKEDIVLEKNVGSKFSFILETGDLVPVLENGVIYIRDESGADFGLISPTYVYDSFVFAFDQDNDTFQDNYLTFSDKKYCQSTSVENALKRTEERMKDWLNDTFASKWRTASGYNDLLATNEYLVAMRVGIIENNDYDYHFWYRASNGKWYNKHESSPSEEVSGNVVNPSTANTSDGWKNSSYSGGQFYTSDIVYYAVKQ